MFLDASGAAVLPKGIDANYAIARYRQDKSWLDSGQEIRKSWQGLIVVARDYINS